MEKVRYEEMLPHEIVERRRKFPAAFIGLGGLEWHSKHLAVGNDALKAEKLCELAARTFRRFRLPHAVVRRAARHWFDGVQLRP